VTEHVDVLLVAAVSAHGLPAKAPVPPELKLTEPVGDDFVPAAVSVTVAVQVEAWFRATDAGEHETAVDVLRTALNVTVNAPLPPAPKIRLHGFVVVLLHVSELVLAAALQPANTDPDPAVARNVIVAPLSDVEMFGEQVLVTVWEVAFVPVPPHAVGALIVPVLGVNLTDPPPAPANVRTQLRAAI